MAGKSPPLSKLEVDRKSRLEGQELAPQDGTLFYFLFCGYDVAEEDSILEVWGQSCKQLMAVKINQKKKIDLGCSLRPAEVHVRRNRLWPLPLKGCSPKCNHGD